MASQLATATRCKVLSASYPLAPERSFPTQLDHLERVYRWVLDSGVPAKKLVLVGDSVGGGLVVATLLRLRAINAPRPRGAVCVSPVFDLTLSAPSIDKNSETDPQVPLWLLRQMVSAYLGGVDPTNPMVSPLFADLDDLPPMLIQVGGWEALLDDSTRFAAKAQNAGTDVRLSVWPEAMHLWHAFAPRLAIAREAFVEIAEWVTELLCDDTLKDEVARRPQ